jgi:TonB family protein
MSHLQIYSSHIHCPSLAIILVSTLLLGCVSPKLIHKPLLIAPPLPERYLTGNLNEYYPDASKRAHETGEVIVNFTVAANGVVNNITVNEHASAPFPRLLNAATKIVQGLKLAVGDKYKTSLTMSIVFEIAPCGIVSHSSGPDYYTFLCVDPIRHPTDDIHPF